MICKFNFYRQAILSGGIVTLLVWLGFLVALILATFALAVCLLRLPPAPVLLYDVLDFEITIGSPGGAINCLDQFSNYLAFSKHQ